MWLYECQMQSMVCKVIHQCEQHGIAENKNTLNVSYEKTQFMLIVELGWVRYNDDNVFRINHCMQIIFKMFINHEGVDG